MHKRWHLYSYLNINTSAYLDGLKQKVIKTMCNCILVFKKDAYIQKIINKINDKEIR